jgi:hypothetical protein
VNLFYFFLEFNKVFKKALDIYILRAYGEFDCDEIHLKNLYLCVFVIYVQIIDLFVTEVKNSAYKRKRITNSNILLKNNQVLFKNEAAKNQNKIHVRI